MPTTEIKAVIMVNDKTTTYTFSAEVSDPDPLMQLVLSLQKELESTRWELAVVSEEAQTLRRQQETTRPSLRLDVLTAPEEFQKVLHVRVAIDDITLARMPQDTVMRAVGENLLYQLQKALYPGYSPGQASMPMRKGTPDANENVESGGATGGKVLRDREDSPFRR